MLSATAFACIRSHRMPVRRIQLTRELKALLIFLRFAGIANEPIDSEPILTEGIGDGQEQRLELVYTSSGNLLLPSLEVLKNASNRGGNVTNSLRGFGISIHDCIASPTKAAARDYWNDLDRAFQLLNRLAYAAEQVSRFGETVRQLEAFEKRHRADDHLPFFVLDDLNDVFGPNPATALRLLSASRVCALLAVEPLPGETESRIRLYRQPPLD
jgi:hypothetical protein